MKDEESRSPSVFRFGDYKLDLRQVELRKSGRRVRIQEKPLEVLALLVERPGELVSRGELQQRLWPDSTVDFERGLNTAVNKLRSVLNDTADSPRFIETVPRHGYRFVAPVERSDPGASGKPPGGQPGGKADRGRLSSRGWISAVAVLIAVLVVLAVLRAGWRTPGAPDVDDGRRRLAVLPFQNMGTEPGQDYLSDGLTEEMILHLAQLNPEQLGIIARTSVMRYKDSPADIGQIARDLDVDFVLEGSVLRSEDLLRITTQLIRTEDQSHVWAESYERNLQDWFAVQREVAERVAQELNFQMLTSEAASSPLPNTRAYEEYLKGRHFRNQVTVTGFSKALEHFDQAIALEEDFAAAYAAKAGCHCLLSGHGFEVVRPADAMPQAREAALRALELDDSLAEAHAVLGMVNMKYTWDFPAAEAAFRRALQLDANYAQGHLWYSMFLEAMDRRDEALREARRARELDPLSREANVNLGIQLLQAGHLDRASQQLATTLDLSPDFWGAHWSLGRYRLELGQYAQSIAHFRRADELADGNVLVLAALGHAHGLAGQREEAVRILQELNLLSRTRYVSPALVAFVHTGLGDADTAFARLEEAAELRSRYLVWLRVAPEYRSLREDPRFEKLAGRIGLLPASRRSR